MPSPTFNIKNLLGGLSAWMADFAADHHFVPTRRGRLLLAMLLLASVAVLLEEDDPSPALRKKLGSFFGLCMTKNDKAEEYFYDLLGVRFGVDADFSVAFDSTLN